jgi:cytochrome c oxidase subunit 1
VNADTSAATTGPSLLRGRFAQWIFATDHRRVGTLWLAVGGTGIALSAILALVVALQTARADSTLLGEGTFASVVTMQATLLTYGGLLPLVLGLAVAIVPLQIGARGLALPQLSTGGVWLGVAGVTTIVLSSFASGDAPRSWWTTSPPLALDQARPGESIRLMGLVLVGLGALLTAIALVATLRDRRAPGMTNERLPLFTQSVGIFAVSLLVLAPVALFGDLLLILARENPGSFDWYITDDGGLLRGYGWMFGQGLIAATIVPALGIAAELVATFRRGPLGSRRLVTLGLVATAVLVVIVPSADLVEGRTWAAVLALLAAVPAAAAALVLLPAGLGAMRTGPTTPLPFALGSLSLTLLGALASLILVVRHDDLGGTTFATARLDLFWTAALLAALGGAVYWWPKLFGRMLDARLTNLSAVVLFASAVLLAVGRAAAGWSDQGSRTGVTVDDAATASLVAAIGVAGILAGLLLFGLAKLGARRGRRVGNDPWDGDTLEWYTASPPPLGNFTSVPAVESERPLADLRRSLREQGAL